MKILCVVVAASSLCLTAPAEDYLGAQGALDKLAAAAGSPVAPEKKVDPLQAWESAVKEYVAASARLEPAEAARRWLALFDGWQKLTSLPPTASAEQQPIHDLFAALPPPAAWDALVAAIAARPAPAKAEPGEKALPVLAAMLAGDHARLRTAAAELEKALPREMQMALEGEGSQGLSAWIASIDDSPAETLAALEKQIAAAEKGEFPGDLGEIPDLVTMAGPEKAEALLRRILRIRNLQVREVRGDATQALAVKVATELAPTAERPDWQLVKGFSRETMALFEALDRRFPRGAARETDEMGRASAERWYLYGLIAANRAQEAAKFAAAMAKRTDQGEMYGDFEATEALVRSGYAAQVRAFFREALDKDPALPYWETFIRISARSGDAAEALAFLRATAARPGLAPAARAKIDARLWQALLAADEVEEGVKLLRELLVQKLAETKKRAENVARRSGYIGYENNAARPMARQLGQLGRLLQKPEWVEESLRAGRETLEAISAESMGYDYYSTLRQMAQTLIELGRGPEAEALVVDAAARAVKWSKENPRQSYGLRPDEPLHILLDIYDRAGRPDDVLKLLAEAKDWPAADLAGLMDEPGEGKHPVGYVVASALVAKGRKEEARLVLEQLLLREGGYDPAYELLLSLGGADLIPKLDALAARDRFEERPLIWKAKLQFEAGQLEEAEKTVRAAITIDPSDGEQGKGSRMRAYAVLGDILEKKGDAAQAQIMRGAVEAIRISENADDWWQAGLLSRAVKMYEGALGHFADAYCVQSRLALRYSELGDNAKAEEHYRRAYELMPTSFGRVESHCFGCEGVFNGKRAQGIADKVFTRLAETTPDKPQVYYLLGYLREAQGNFPEAAAQYRHALQLDPDYLNAWERLAGLNQRMAFPHAEREKAALAILHLDPLHRHEGHSFSGNSGVGAYGEISDLRKLWAELQRTVELQAAVRETIFPLAAAKAAQEEREKAAKAAGNQQEWEMRNYYGRMRGDEGAHFETASQALARHTFFTLLQQMMWPEL